MSVSDKNSQIDEFRIGQLELDPNLRSKANFDIARKWLWACKHQHTDCLSGRASNLPTRVIDVGVDVQFRDVHILCSPPGLEGQYATLSHCWGGTISPLLTENTLASFQESLPYTTLPANFQDAITITRELGIRYLWIDSLCIKQDSKEDWEKESKNMAAVYRDSTLTISALASRGSTHGILTTESPKSSPTPATLKLLPDSPESGELVVQWRDNDDEYDANQYDIVYACPLVGRAWALQEYVLSPRQLFYGKDAIYWKCPQGFEGANGLPSGFEFPGGRSKEISSILLSEVVRQGSIPQANKKDAILEEYYDMVQTYSSKALSVESDKLPAFSGIAQRLHPALEGHYLAGIWSCDIHRGLLWRGVLSTAKRVRLYRAPSWSWAVTDSPVYFPIFSGKNSPLDAQLLNFTIVPKDKTNPYGEILSGSLTLKGLTIPLVRSTQSPEESEDKDFSYISFDEIGIDIQARIPRFKGIYGIYKRYFHRALSVVEGGSSENISALLAEKGSFWKNGSPTYRERCLALLIHLGDYEGHCLVLQKVHGRGPNTYERVGYMRLTRRRYAWYRRWTSKTLTLV